MSVQITARYLGNLRVQATHGPSQAVLQTDAPLDNGGQGAAFSPTDMMATALGTCVLTILGLVADRHDVNIGEATVSVEKHMINEPIRRIGKLLTVVTLPESIPAEMRMRLEAAASKCPVHQSLHPEIHAPIEFRYQ